MINPGEKCKIFIETLDGKVFEMTSIVTSMDITIQNDIIDTRSWGDEHSSYIAGLSSIDVDLKLRGASAPIWTTGKAINLETHKSEWKCDYCGSVHKREKTGCDKCGAVRSFIYD